MKTQIHSSRTGVRVLLGGNDAAITITLRQILATVDKHGCTSAEAYGKWLAIKIGAEKDQIVNEEILVSHYELVGQQSAETYSIEEYAQMLHAPNTDREPNAGENGASALP